MWRGHQVFGINGKKWEKQARFIYSYLLQLTITNYKMQNFFGYKEEEKILDNTVLPYISFIGPNHSPLPLAF